MDLEVVHALDIGGYLGLKLETVSRVMSRLQSEGLIATNRHHVRIYDPTGLAHVARGMA